MRKGCDVFILVALIAVSATQPSAQNSSALPTSLTGHERPLVLTEAIPLENAKGRFDHFAVGAGTLFVSALGSNAVEVKGGVKLDDWGGGKLDQMSVRDMGIGREGGVWSGGLRSGLRTAFRPERKTPPSARDVVVI